jgi:hypothetical protein
MNAEIDARRVQERLRKLEDPISELHPAVREFSELLYSRTADADDENIKLSEDEVRRYARVLAILEAAGMIGGTHSFTQQFVSGVRLSNPAYVLYMAALYEDPDLMERVVQRVDSTQPRTWLDGRELATEYALPPRTVRAVLQTFEQRGLGIMSHMDGGFRYLARA